MTGFSNTRAATGGLAARSAALDSLRGLMPPGDSRDRAAYLCRQGQYRAVLGDSAALPLVRQGSLDGGAAR